jgi:septum formation protein
MWKNKYILASQSPRRKELLQLLDIDFTIIKSDIEEIVEEGIPFEQVVMDLARQKAQDIAKDHPDSTVLGFDTLVIFKDQALGKPQDRDDAFRMLQMLSGHTHTVITGCALVCCEEVHTLYDQADVTFAPMSDEEIQEYLDTGEPFDKAGSYGIQGYGAKYISKVNGDYYSVMGVPLHKLYSLLRGK